MKFRHDINALRALAVFVVLLFHLDFTLLTGGYTGVDIFFVISGYLISKSILLNLENNTFDLIEFYTKRIKRLFPSLIFVSTIVLISGFFILTPIDYKNLAQSVLASNFFANNIFFWLETGYFDALKNSKPLLHYWSLAVELQFYILYPVLFLFIKKNKLPLKSSVLLLFLLSFLLAIIGNQYSPSASFYLLPFRIFEFSLGTFAVILKFDIKENLKKIITILSFTTIFICSVTYKNPTFFSYYNLYPCLATFFIINLNSQGKFLNGIYNNKIIQLIGTTSYSTYLIHWPLITFYKYHISNELTLVSKTFLFSLSLLLGYVIWKYVENILRNPKRNLKNLSIGILISASFSIITITTDGFSNRYPLLKSLITIEELKNEKDRYWTELHYKIKDLDKYDKETIIIGNSHAIDLSYAFIENNIKTKISFLQTDYRCYNCNKPIEKKDKNLCNDLNEKNFNHSAWKTASSIFIHDHWPVLDTTNLRVFLSKIRQKTKTPIYVFGPKLTFIKPALNIIHASKSTNINEINYFAFQQSKINDRKKINQNLIDFFKTYTPNTNIKYIDILKIQCGKHYNTCEIISSSTSKLQYFDLDHFTRDGSIELGKKLKTIYPTLFQ